VFCSFACSANEQNKHHLYYVAPQKGNSVAPSVADVIAGQLAAAGVRRLYGLPGGEMLDIMEACRRVDISFVLAHHESAAAFMAAAEGRYRRAPAACIATLGPGATNLVSGVAHAALDRSPVVVITADSSTTFHPDHTHQRLDLPALFAPITKRSYLVDAASAATQAAEAIELAATEPFGPTSLHVPRNVAVQAASTASEQPAPAASVSGDLSFDDLAEYLNQAQRPLVMIGMGAPPSLVPALRQFVETYAAPVGVTPNAKGFIDEAHPLFTGTYGGMMAESLLAEFMAERDLVLCIGLDPNEIDIDWPDQERFCWMLASPNVYCTSLPPRSWYGDLETGLRTLTPLVTPRSEGLVAADGIRRRIRQRLEDAIPENRQGLSPYRVLQYLAANWDPSAPVCCDVGAHKLLIGQCWPASVPNRFTMSNGLSSMGYGIAAPIGLHLASGAPVLSVVGDGGMLMYAGGLETAVRLKSRVLYVVLYDGTLALIESSQQRRGYDLYGVRFTPPEIGHLGAAFGIPTWEVTSEADLHTAISAFLSIDGPVLVGVRIDPREYYAQVG
jgi:acetolactate synthase-1/2/3 large subunit